VVAAEMVCYDIRDVNKANRCVRPRRMPESHDVGFDQEQSTPAFNYYKIRFYSTRLLFPDNIPGTGLAKLAQRGTFEGLVVRDICRLDVKAFDYHIILHNIV